MQRMRVPPRQALVIASVLLGVETVTVWQRRGFLVGLDTVVKCRRGHLFTTWWIPGVSIKALRFGWWRLQYCPIGSHLSLVVPISTTRLSQDQRRAAERHDLRVP